MSATVRPATFLALSFGLMFSACCPDPSPTLQPRQIMLKLTVGPELGKIVKNVHVWLSQVNTTQDAAMQPQLPCPGAPAQSELNELACSSQMNGSEYVCRTSVAQAGIYPVTALALDGDDEMNAFGCIVATAQDSLAVTLNEAEAEPALEKHVSLKAIDRASCHLCAEITTEGEGGGEVTVTSASFPTPRTIGNRAGYYYPLGESVTATAVSSAGKAITMSLNSNSPKGCASVGGGECPFTAWSAAKLSVTFK